MNIIQLSIVVGVFMPLAISGLAQEHWSANIKAGVALGLCLIAAALTALATGALDLKHWGEAIVAVYGSAQVLYHSLWKDTGVTGIIHEFTDFPLKR